MSTLTTTERKRAHDQAWWYASGRYDEADTPWEDRHEERFTLLWIKAVAEYQDGRKGSRPSMRCAFRLFTQDGSFDAFYDNTAVHS